jgi:hypothetical protein
MNKEKINYPIEAMPIDYQRRFKEEVRKAVNPLVYGSQRDMPIEKKGKELPDPPSANAGTVSESASGSTLQRGTES